MFDEFSEGEKRGEVRTSFINFSRTVERRISRITRAFWEIRELLGTKNLPA